VLGTLLNQQYPNYATWTLTSPVIYIGPNFVLEFWQWYDMEQGYDGGNLKISTNSGGSWTLLTPEGVIHIKMFLLLVAQVTLVIVRDGY
jgi:hypothetical protein